MPQYSQGCGRYPVRKKLSCPPLQHGPAGRILCLSISASEQARPRLMAKKVFETAANTPYKSDLCSKMRYSCNKTSEPCHKRAKRIGQLPQNCQKMVMYDSAPSKTAPHSEYAATTDASCRADRKIRCVAEKTFELEIKSTEKWARDRQMAKWPKKLFARQ